ncbi:MAG: preprotein translocase subunit SecA, partial [Actinomycetota bacterium]|nr:preprotein translocase subunit SecA [Actinomycetota bacterium]
MPVLDKIANLGEGRKLKNLADLAKLVNTYEPEVEDLSDDELRDNTIAFKERVANGEALDDLLPEAFAAVREAARRTIGQRHFDVQLMGGAALHQGNIAEMKTGEGKTLVSTLPGYLNALEGKGVHIVTVNDYLAKRDSEWMGGIYRFLGLNVGLIQASMTPQQRRPAYEADITYGTNNEFGFDYLRDNMAMRLDECVQRGYRYAIVDEVDSILIDEARTPLIISGMVADSAKWYQTFAKIVPRLSIDEDYEVEEAKYQVAVTEQGVARVEELLNIENLYDSSNTMLVHHLHNALRAKELYKRDVAYVVQNGEVKIVDEFTGRVLEGRRYSEGLHQAIEAKEGVRIKEENQTLATITIQNYFKMYDKLAGMTGTAKTQLTEFEETYKIGVVEIPTNAPNIRDDKQDLIYKSEDEKWDAVADDIIERNERGQPILVGTVSIEKSERLSGVLNRRGIQHNVLNAKNHEKEAVIVAQAGRKGSVTVATNMAGRGVDILLGGNAEYLARQEMAAREWDNDRYLLFEMDEDERAAYETEYEPILTKFRAQTDAEHDEVVGLGGLYVQGTERHESRRIDNQLRGRSGRQGDPGESLFYLSLEDDLMRMFASDRVAAIMNRFKWPEGEPIEAKMVSRAVENAQKQIEELNYERRKNVLKYDEVMNGQRTVIYGERRKILEGHDLKEQALGFVEDVIADVVVSRCPPDTYAEDWDREALLVALGEFFPVRSTAADIEEVRDVTELQSRFVQEAEDAYEAKEEAITPEIMRELERVVLLNITDTKWREHLYEMDYLQEGIHLRAYAQRDPLTEYQREAFMMFDELTGSIQEDFVKYIYRVELVRQDQPPA